LEGTKLHVAEMGLVGTQENHRGRGLMRTLNREFDKTLDEEKFDLAVIQGIPGFYHQFGYHYAIPLENHINMPLHISPFLRSETKQTGNTC
jgi:predicted acetyltransferase